MTELNTLTATKPSFFNKRLLPLLIFFSAGIIAYFLFLNPPKAEKKPKARPVLVVKASPVHKQSHQVSINSFGVVSPKTQGSLASQVSGSITQLGSKNGNQFQVGDFFKKGELLLTIDDSDYRLSLDIAKATLTEAKLRLTEEKARVKQAKKDWKRLGKGGEPSGLVLRKPQLASAQASIQSANASLKKAKLALSRTKINAPYDGRLLTKNVDIGQFVQAGATLATIFSTQKMQVRLPLNTQQQSLINLPEPKFGQPDNQLELPKVVFTSTAHNTQNVQIWHGQLLRAEAALDTNTRQLYVIAQIDDPFINTKQRPIKIGQFVQATIEGVILNDVYKIPRASLYLDQHVILWLF